MCMITDLCNTMCEGVLNVWVNGRARGMSVKARLGGLLLREARTCTKKEIQSGCKTQGERGWIVTLPNFISWDHTYCCSKSVLIMTRAQNELFQGISLLTFFDLLSSRKNVTEADLRIRVCRSFRVSIFTHAFSTETEIEFPSIREG